MDAFDRQRYAAAYRALAEILDHDRPEQQVENHLSYTLGDLARRVFVGSAFLPPDELLEQLVEVLRAGETEEHRQMAARLREHAEHLDQLPQ